MKHLTRDDLLQQMKYTANVRKRAAGSSFTGMAILGNYILWKTEGWWQKRLGEYNERVKGYYDAEPSIHELSNRLYHTADFTVEVEERLRQGSSQKKSHRYRQQIKKKLMEAEDEISLYSQKYLLIHFNVLIDMGYGKKRLNRVKDAMNQKLKEINDPMGEGAMEMRQELIDNVGIYIEMPA